MTGACGTARPRLGEETRRGLLAKAGMLSGGMGLVALHRAESASAYHNVPTPTSAPAAGSGDLAVSNVKDWGAIGDGVHDDQPNIQACINHAVAGAAPGDRARVYVPPGTYRLATFSETAILLALPSDTFLFGDGQFSILKADRPTTDVRVVVGTLGDGSQSNIHIEDLVVDCNSNSLDYAIKMVGTEASPCRDCFLRRVEVRNHKYESPGAAVRISYWLNGAIEGCYVHGTRRDGLNVRGGGVVISGNVVEDCGDDHIVANGQLDGGVTVIGNVINANTTTRGAGIVVGSYDVGGVDFTSRHVTITGNVVFGGVRGGVDLRGGCEDVVVANNVIMEAGNTSGTARPGDTLLAWGRGRGSGVSLDFGAYPGDITRVAISGNVITKPRNNGIMLASGRSTSTMTDVSVSGNVILMDEFTPIPHSYPDPVVARRGIAIRNFDPSDPLGPVSGVQIKDNQVVRATSEGIYAKGTLIDRLDIHQNTVVDSGPSGSLACAIRIVSVGSTSIVANRAHEAEGGQGVGLDVQDCTGTLVIVGNDFVQNGAGTITYQAIANGPSALRIGDNPGFNPWAGQLPTPVGPWASFQPYTGGPMFYRKDVPVTFGVPFPAGTTPKVVGTARTEGFGVTVSAGANPHVSQTLHVWVPQNDGVPGLIDPNTIVLVNWVAEPVD